MLTDAKVRNARYVPLLSKGEKNPGQQLNNRLPDRDGLYLCITPNNAKSWRYDFRYNGKRQCVTFGRYPEIPLSSDDPQKPGARQKLAQARAALAQGVNPARLGKEASQAYQPSQDTFKTIAEDWFKSLEAGKSESWQDNARRWLDHRIYPAIGARLIKDVSPADVLSILKAMEKDGVSRSGEAVRQTIGQIYKYAMRNLRVESGLNPAEGIAGAITLPDHVPHKHLSEKELPAFLDKTEGMKTEEPSDARVKLAVRLLLLTFVRHCELIKAKWSEIDFDRKEWRIPKERVKAIKKKKRELLVPLSRQALECFQELKKLAGDSEYVFPSPQKRNQPISDGLLLIVFRKLGAGITPHGVRATASSILNERSGFPGDVIEAQLAHAERDQVRAAYNRAQWLEQRSALMSWWADYLDNAKQGNVITLPRRA